LENFIFPESHNFDIVLRFLFRTSLAVAVSFSLDGIPPKFQAYSQSVSAPVKEKQLLKRQLRIHKKPTKQIGIL
jgi:hypothetical protein